jgi:hypothetical protein
MRRATIGGFLLLVLVLSLAPTSASAGTQKLVEGTVYDNSCGAVCLPECPPPPHCGPLPAPQARSAVVCAQTEIVCPLYRLAPGGSIYTGEGSLVNVRRRGSEGVIARLPIVEGHFKIRLDPGEYVFRPYMAEEQCWSADQVVTTVTAKSVSPVGVAMSATNRCVVHPL